MHLRAVPTEEELATQHWGLVIFLAGVIIGAFALAVYLVSWISTLNGAGL
jgi:hypothetical protein